MQVTSENFPDRFLILPNLEYFFGECRNDENCLDVIESFAFGKTAEVHMLRLGALAFKFLEEGDLRSITHYRTTGSGTIPDHVTENHDQIVELQGRRLSFANFVAAALFGRISALRHSALSGAQYAGMEEILGWGRQGGQLVTEPGRHADEIFGPKVRLAQAKPTGIKIVTTEEISKLKEFLAHLADRQTSFDHADLQTCMLMNYQAAILHSEQHSAASVALNFAVAEALVNEIFYAYGLVGTRTAQAFATRPHSVTKVSGNAFGKMTAEQKIDALTAGKLIDAYLGQRLKEARTARNHLMHRAAVVTVRESGNAQTAIRDLWSLLLDYEFELLAGWSMRI